MPQAMPTTEPLLPKGATERSGQADGRRMSLSERVGSMIHITGKEFRSKMFAAKWYGLVSGAAVLITLLVMSWNVVPELSVEFCGEKEKNVQTVQHFSSSSENLVAVNFGGWLCLEDWFHSGSVGRYVSTPNQMPQGQGACLPPLLTGPLDEPWPSEGILTKRLADQVNKSYAADVFMAFRKDFIFEKDWEEVASLGIKTVRIPFSWAMFADALAPIDQATYGSHNPDTDAVVVPDPFHHDKAAFVTIPRKWFKSVLELGASYGLRFILDLHNMPGGSSDGTYSGIWPMRPAFWNETAQFGDRSIALKATGEWISAALIKYIEEDLADLVQKKAIWGICFMNEPAHLSGIHAKWGQFATPQQVLAYVDSAADKFRKSTLPSEGVRLYIQLIETAWPSGKEFDEEVPHWYHTHFTSQERYTWAVMARHFYTAWGCNGRITPGASYQCDHSTDSIRAVLNTCIGNFAKGFALKFHGLRAVTEWSLGSYADANMACSNSEVTRAIFEENVKAFASIEPEIQIEPVFWSWKMPYGPKFQPGWSLKSFSGMDELADSNGRCIVGKWANESPEGVPPM